MKRVPAHFGVTGWLAVAVLVLVPLLAVLQYRWLGQLSDGEHERMQRTLTTAAQQLALDVNNELSRALTGLQIDATTLDRQAWDVVAQRFDSWAASASSPGLVDGIYLAIARTAADTAAQTPALELLAWNAASHTFEEAAWTGALASVLPGLQAHVRQAARRGEGPGSGERIDRMMPAHALGEARALVSPIVRVSFPEPRRDGRIGPPDVTLLGFTILTLDLDVLSGQLLPALVRRHLYNADGRTEYRIAVMDRDDPARVLFESEPGAAAAVLTRHDAGVDLLSTGPNTLLFAARGLPADAPRGPGAGGPREGALALSPGRVLVNLLETGRGEDRATTVQTRLFSGRDGHWRLLVAHQSGSLEAAVAAARLRNLLLSSGILLLLTVAIGLIVGSARRAHRLARQRMEFVAVVTHELRTPVAVINSTAGNLADGVVGDPARVKTYGATIQGEARRLGETVERVLQLAGLETGRGTLARGAVAPDALVRESVEACRADIARHGATVETDVAPDLPSIAGEATALRSAVQNLLGNAVKYGGDAPWVRVSVRAERDGAARLQARAPAIAIMVEDRGLGIAAEDRPHVFEPFYRGREALLRQIQGSGLGLSLVARIADAHGGRVTLESEPGRGSTFTLHLPAAPPARAAGQPAGVPAAGSLPAGHVG